MFIHEAERVTIIQTNDARKALRRGSYYQEHTRTDADKRKTHGDNPQELAFVERTSNKHRDSVGLSMQRAAMTPKATKALCSADL